MGQTWYVIAVHGWYGTCLYGAAADRADALVARHVEDVGPADRVVRYPCPGPRAAHALIVALEIEAESESPNTDFRRPAVRLPDTTLVTEDDYRATQERVDALLDQDPSEEQELELDLLVDALHRYEAVRDPAALTHA